MTRIPPRYSPEQREAIYRLIHEEGKTAVEAVALAAQGVYGLEPFDMPASSAPNIAGREQTRQWEERLARLDGGSMADQLLAARLRLIGIHRSSVRAFSTDVDLAAGRFDPELLRWLVRCQKEFERLGDARSFGASESGLEGLEQTRRGSMSCRRSSRGKRA
jgi:hypothetical protein